MQDVQFFREASDVQFDETGNRKRKYRYGDEDEIEMEQQERKRRQIMNKEFKSFAEKITEASTSFVCSSNNTAAAQSSNYLSCRLVILWNRISLSENCHLRVSPSARMFACSLPPSVLSIYQILLSWLSRWRKSRSRPWSVFSSG